VQTGARRASDRSLCKRDLFFGTSRRVCTIAIFEVFVSIIPTYIRLRYSTGQICRDSTVPVDSEIHNLLLRITRIFPSSLLFVSINLEFLGFAESCTRPWSLIRSPDESLLGQRDIHPIPPPLLDQYIA
jgi:hypothetical protein